MAVKFHILFLALFVKPARKFVVVMAFAVRVRHLLVVLKIVVIAVTEFVILLRKALIIVITIVEEFLVPMLVSVMVIPEVIVQALERLRASVVVAMAFVRRVMLICQNMPASTVAREELGLPSHTEPVLAIN
jgi:hypothetical protein